MADETVDQQLKREQGERNAHWAAHPLPHPSYNDRPLQIGDRIRTKPGHYYREGVVTEIKVRCYGIARDENITGRNFEVLGKRAMQQIWISIDGMNVILQPEDIAEVIDGK